MGIKVITDNRKAFYNFEIVDKYEAGLVLTGSEVKSIRAGNVNLKDSFVVFRKGEAFLAKAHIAPYLASSYNNHEPERHRKLLLSRNEIDKLMGQVQEKSLSCVPLKMYFKGGRIKLEIGLGKGKKLHDKRRSIKDKDTKRELQRSMKVSR